MKSPAQSRPDLVSALHNPGPPRNDRSLGAKHGGVLAGLEQPRARQSCRRSRLVAHTAVGHALDHQRARLKASPRKSIRRGEATGEPTPPEHVAPMRTQRSRFGIPTVTAGPGQFGAID